MGTEGELPQILPCSVCGGRNQTVESSRPLGRMVDVWRVVCSCGNFSAQWSVSKPAAIRLWNRYVTNNRENSESEPSRSGDRS